MWNTATTVRFDEWFATLGEDARVEIGGAVEVLSTIGPTLGRPYVDTLKGSKHANMKELRLSVSGMVIRIAFAFDPLQTAILLVGGDKGGVSEKRFYRQLIAAAEVEYGRHLESIRRRIEKRNAGRKKGRK